MKKILIFYGSYGGGHLAAAKTIRAYLEEKYKNQIEIEMIDCIEYINKVINKVSTEAYKELAKKAPWVWKQVYTNSQHGALSRISTTTNKLMSLKLNTLLQEVKPDLIISTHPFSTQMCAILKEKGKIDCRLATIMTDYHTHDQWLVAYKYVDYFFVANQQMKTDMIMKGINSQKIFVTGIPVSERFLKKYNKDEICKELGLSPNKQTMLFFAGGEFGLGRNSTYMTLKVLIRLFKDLQVIAISGKNKKMNKKFNNLVKVTKSEDRIKIFEFTDKIPEIMSISSAVITKAGGLTITESLVSGLPIAIINPIPGQEVENTQYLVDNGVAVWIKKDYSVARALKNLYKNQDLLKDMANKSKQMSKPNATSDMCKIMIEQLL